MSERVDIHLLMLNTSFVNTAPAESHQQNIYTWQFTSLTHKLSVGRRRVIVFFCQPTASWIASSRQHTFGKIECGVTALPPLYIVDCWMPNARANEYCNMLSLHSIHFNGPAPHSIIFSCVWRCSQHAQIAPGKIPAMHFVNIRLIR